MISGIALNVLFWSTIITHIVNPLNLPPDEDKIFPEQVVKNIQQGGDKKLFEKAGYKTLTGGSYRSMWWVIHNNNGAFAARGVHGQTIYIDPKAEMVIVRFASFPTAKNAQIDPTSLPAYEAVAEYLIQKNKL